MCFLFIYLKIKNYSFGGSCHQQDQWPSSDRWQLESRNSLIPFTFLLIYYLILMLSVIIFKYICPYMPKMQLLQLFPFNFSLEISFFFQKKKKKQNAAGWSCFRLWLISNWFYIRYNEHYELMIGNIILFYFVYFSSLNNFCLYTLPKPINVHVGWWEWFFLFFKVCHVIVEILKISVCFMPIYMLESVSSFFFGNWIEAKWWY